MTQQEIDEFTSIIRTEIRKSFEILVDTPSEMSKSEAAKRLNISRPTLNKRIEQGLIEVNENGKISRLTVFKQMK